MKLVFKKSIYYLLIFISASIFAQDKTETLFKGTNYIESIPDVKSILNFDAGQRPARYNEVYQFFQTLSESSARVKMLESGETHEGRSLFYAIISSEKNLNNLNQIKNNLGLLADPRKKETQSKSSEIIKTNPATAVMMYSIHGDEFLMLLRFFGGSRD